MRTVLRQRSAWGLALAGLFALRLVYGLCFEFFFEDYTQTFLIGLRAYAGHRWPYFGADVVWTKSQIPGALQGLLVAVPMMIAPVPEAPFVLLNLISMAALALLAWYIGQRLPTLPRWLVWGWLMTIPWTINFSTSMINTSYILPGAVLFFVGFFEAHPRFSLGRLSSPVAHFMMGAAIAWLLQIHMSWPLVLPYVGLAVLARRQNGWRAMARDLAALAAGAAVPGVLLVPTLLRFGIHAGSGGVGRNLHVHLIGLGVPVTTTARFLSFASLEVVRFIATDTPKRIMFLSRHLWIAPLLAVVWAVGIVHPVAMARLWFKTRHPARDDWPALRLLVVGTIAIVCAAYCFVLEPPQAHAFYVVAPIAMVFAAYCWSFVDRPAWRRVAGAVLAINIAYHLGLALAEGPNRSMYKNRAVVAAAVAGRDPELFSHRREYAMDAVPAIDAQARRDPRDEIALVAPTWSIGPGRSIVWNVTIRNDSANRAYRDLLYRTTYEDATGRPVLARHGYILDIVQPGEARVAEINDGAADTAFSRATLEVVLAESLKALPKKTP
jgi:hypothetical protein